MIPRKKASVHTLCFAEIDVRALNPVILYIQIVHHRQRTTRSRLYVNKNAFAYCPILWWYTTILLSYRQYTHTQRYTEPTQHTCITYRFALCQWAHQVARCYRIHTNVYALLLLYMYDVCLCVCAPPIRRKYRWLAAGITNTHFTFDDRSGSHQSYNGARARQQ